MSVAFFVHFDAEGVITQVAMCPESMLDSQMPPDGGGQIAISAHPTDPFAFIKQNCVIGGQIVPKIGMGLSISATSFPADGTSDVTIGGIPAGASVTISGAVSAGPETVTDGQLAITSNVAGSILVTITAPPMYFDWSITLNAT